MEIADEEFGTLEETPPYSRISSQCGKWWPLGMQPHHWLHYSLQSREWKPTQGTWASLRILYIGPLFLYWSHAPSFWFRSWKDVCDWQTQFKHCALMENQIKWWYFVVAWQRQLHFDHIILTPRSIYSRLGKFLD